MVIKAAIELSRDADVTSQQQVAATAYRLSRNGTVILLLNGVDRNAVDRFLDPIVALEGIGVAGVLYYDAASDAPETAAALRQAVTVITSTRPLCDSLRAQGIPSVLACKTETMARTLAAL